MYISDRSLILKFFTNYKEKKWLMNKHIKTIKNGEKEIQIKSTIKSNNQTIKKNKYKIFLQCIFCFCYRFIEGRSTRTAGLSQGGPTWRWIIGDYP